MSRADESDALGIGLAALAGTFVLGAGLGLWRAFVVAKAWTWLLVPLGAPRVTTLQVLVMGLVTDLAYMFPKPKDPRGFGELLLSGTLHGVLGPLAALGVAWLAAGRIS